MEKPDILGVKIKGVRQTRNIDIFIEVEDSAESRSNLSSAIRKAVGVEDNVRKLVPRTEVQIK